MMELQRRLVASPSTSNTFSTQVIYCRCFCPVSSDLGVAGAASVPVFVLIIFKIFTTQITSSHTSSITYSALPKEFAKNPICSNILLANKILYYAKIAQLAEHSPEEGRVDSAILSLGT